MSSSHSSAQRVQKPPAYWDNISRVWLTKGALQELQRRIGHPEQEPDRPRPSKSAIAVIKRFKGHLGEIKRFSRHGGPDKGDLRGCPPPGSRAHGMAATRLKRNERKRKRPLTDVDDGTAVSPYSKNFAQNLVDGRIYPPMHRYAETGIKRLPLNFAEIRQRLKDPHPSLSPPDSCKAEFEKLEGAHWSSSGEPEVSSSEFPIVEGTVPQYKSGGKLFNRFAPLTPGNLTLAKPDIFYGARPEDVNPEIRKALMEMIVPSTDTSLPILPNFLIELKGKRGTIEVGERQARYDGAFGARAIHALQSYLPDEPHHNPVYDKNAYTITCLYHSGTIYLYTHHIEPPESRGGQISILMSRLAAYQIMDSAEDYQKGVAAYRNARDWTKEKRDLMISEANAKLRHARQEASRKSLRVEVFAKRKNEEEESGDVAGEEESDKSEEEEAEGKELEKEKAGKRGGGGRGRGRGKGVGGSKEAETDGGGGNSKDTGRGRPRGRPRDRPGGRGRNRH